MTPTNRHATGQAGEYLVASELARQGFAVALPTGNAVAIDILAYGFGQTIPVQVKTIRRGSHQFNLGKFIDLKLTDSGGQEVLGRRKDLDPKIIMAFVWLGDSIGEDEFTWTTLGKFADFLAKSHKAYLTKNGGRRPGKNPASLHAALTKTELQTQFTCKQIRDLLPLESNRG